MCTLNIIKSAGYGIYAANGLRSQLSWVCNLLHRSSVMLLHTAEKNGSHDWHLQAESEERLILDHFISLTSTYLTQSTHQHPPTIPCLHPHSSSVCHPHKSILIEIYFHVKH
ncbi:hypothetical protein AMECASPLE_019454 [Ameca splendens]|uniref:Uncharacterized protein n=1 Tax=Ameca splendens TaxID=208324 RepID=A0ABV0XG22_9TELE